MADRGGGLRRFWPASIGLLLVGCATQREAPSSSEAPPAQQQPAASERPSLTPAFWEGTGCSRLAYVQVEEAGENRTYSLRVSRADGSDARTVVSSSEPLMTPAWSPDGSRIAYTGFVNGASAVYEQPLGAGTRRTLSMRPGLNSSPSYSPDGHFIVLTLTRGHAVNLFVMDLRNHEVRQITDSDDVDTEAVWSPDGKTIAFTSDRNGPPQVFLVPASGGPATLVSPEKEQSVHAEYTPDGRSLIFVNVHDRSFRICRMDLATKQLTAYTPGRWDESPSLSPDGTRLLWVGGTMSERTLQETRLDINPSPIWVGPAHVEEAVWSACVFPR